MNGFSRMIKEAIVLIALAKAVLHLAKPKTLDSTCPLAKASGNCSTVKRA
jgi:hypothetical protein